MSNKLHWIDLYEKMYKIRRFEEKVSELYAEGEIPGFVHLYIGEEAVAVGACANLNEKDYITSTHRGHGHLIAKGGDVRRMMAELYGKKTGYCNGKGGSMHIADMNLGILGANGIVGGGLPISVGAAYSIKLRKTTQVVIAFFGDGATNEGTFHESLNLASAWKLPVIFVCEKNDFGVSTRIDRITNNTNLSQRAVGYGIPGITIDGNDVLAVEMTVGKAVNRAREGEGPTLIVAETFRHHGHFEGEVVNYWDKSELARWKQKDPISFMRNLLLTAESLQTEEIKDIEEAVEKEIQDAIEFARASEYPQPEQALDDLFFAKEVTAK